MRFLLRAGWLAGIVLFATTADAAITWRVGTPDASACDPPCHFDDSDLSNAGSGIRAALLSNQVVPGDTVLVWPGTYPSRLPMKSGVTVISRNGPTETYVQGSAGLESAVTFTNCDASTVFDGFSVRWSAGADGIGGALRAFVSDGVFRNCVVRECASGIGAGAYLQSSDIVLENNLFLNNNCQAGGGVIAISGGTPLVRDNTFVDCTAPFGADGAVLFAVGSSHTFERNILFRSHGAAAVYCEGTVTADINCNLFFDNELGHFGGACVDSIGTSGNFVQDPQFCDPFFGGHPDIGDFNVCATSVARTTACGTIGWVDPQGEVTCGPCTATPVGANLEALSWGHLKARYVGGGDR
jgi:hypothetical protein